MFRKILYSVTALILSTLFFSCLSLTETIKRNADGSYSLTSTISTSSAMLDLMGMDRDEMKEEIEESNDDGTFANKFSNVSVETDDTYTNISMTQEISADNETAPLLADDRIEIKFDIINLTESDMYDIREDALDIIEFIESAKKEMNSPDLSDEERAFLESLDGIDNSFTFLIDSSIIKTASSAFLSDEEGHQIPVDLSTSGNSVKVSFPFTNLVTTDWTFTKIVVYK